MWSALLFGTASGPLSTLITLQILEIGGGPVQVAYAISLSNVVLIPASMFWGFMADRYDRKNLIIVGFTFSTLSLLVLWIVRSIPVLDLGYAAFTFFSTSYNTPMNLLILEEKAIAAASLGEVHLGRTPDGRIVAVKVNRPHVEEIIKTDLKLVKRLIPMLRLFLDSSFVESFKVIINQFSAKIFEEMDYTKEAFYMRVISEDLKDFRVRTPRPLLATKRVLVMEYLPGIKCTSPEAWKVVDRKSLAWRIFLVFITLVLDSQYFHADPHPGNIAVDGEGNIILYDFGMVGSLDPDTRRKLIRLYVSISQRILVELSESS